MGACPTAAIPTNKKVVTRNIATAKTNKNLFTITPYIIMLYCMANYTHTIKHNAIAILKIIALY